VNHPRMIGWIEAAATQAYWPIGHLSKPRIGHVARCRMPPLADAGTRVLAYTGDRKTGGISHVEQETGPC
jgi:hypothetical protein